MGSRILRLICALLLVTNVGYAQESNEDLGDFIDSLEQTSDPPDSLPDLFDRTDAGDTVDGTSNSQIPGQPDQESADREAVDSTNGERAPSSIGGPKNADGTEETVGHESTASTLRRLPADCPDCNYSCAVRQAPSLLDITNYGFGRLWRAKGVCGSSCQACGYESRGCCCPAGWRVSAEALLLRRSDADSLTLISEQGVPDAPLLNVTDLDFNVSAVSRVSIIHRRTCNKNPCIDCCIDWEIGFFFADSWEVTERPLAVTSPQVIAPANGVTLSSTAPTGISAAYSTDLSSFEFNARYQASPCLDLIAGYRWVELADDLTVNRVQPTFDPLYRIDTNNHLHGFQIGADAQVFNLGCHFHIDAILRAGIFYNRADQNNVSPALGRLGFDSAVSDAESHTAFLGEFGLRGEWLLSDCLSVRVGYQLIWIDGVALAPDQIIHTDLTPTSQASLDKNGDVLYYGTTIGLVLEY